MKQPKYKIGESIFYLQLNKIIEVNILGIVQVVDSSFDEYYYYQVDRLKNFIFDTERQNKISIRSFLSDLKNEDEIFESKEELLASL